MANSRYVPDLPDLIDASEYDQHPDGRLVRLRISATADGVTVLGDAFRPDTSHQFTDRARVLRHSQASPRSG